MELDFKLVGQRIRLARKASGMTTAELAAQVGLTKESLRHIETAASKPRLQTLFRIATILGVSMDFLTGRMPTLAEETILGRGLTTEQEQAVRKVVDSMVSAFSHSG